MSRIHTFPRKVDAWHSKCYFGQKRTGHDSPCSFQEVSLHLAQPCIARRSVMHRLLQETCVHRVWAYSNSTTLYTSSAAAASSLARRASTLRYNQRHQAYNLSLPIEGYELTLARRSHRHHQLAAWLMGITAGALVQVTAEVCNSLSEGHRP